MTAAPTPSGWGGGPWGGSPWGIGAGPLLLERAVAVRENMVRFYFTDAPIVNYLETSYDGGQPSHYQVIAVSGVGLDGEPVRPVLTTLVVVADEPGTNGTAIDVSLDRPMTAYPAIYRAVANALVSEAGTFLDPGSAEFYGLRAGTPPLTPDNNLATSDFLNPQLPGDLVGLSPSERLAALGTYQVAPSGDYANDSPIVSYRKRVFRRLMTIPGGFAHLRGYGVGIGEDVKKPSRGVVRQRRAADAEAQIMLEPETLSVTVTVNNGADGVAYYQVRAMTKLTSNTITMNVPVNTRQPAP